MKFSILIPVYNEKRYLFILLSKVLLSPLKNNIVKEIILIDDCSTDGTRELIKKFQSNPVETLLPYLTRQNNDDQITPEKGEALIRACHFNIIFQPKNMGKGAAIR